MRVRRGALGAGVLVVAALLTAIPAPAGAAEDVVAVSPEQAVEVDFGDEGRAPGRMRAAVNTQSGRGRLDLSWRDDGSTIFVFFLIVAAAVDGDRVEFEGRGELCEEDRCRELIVTGTVEPSTQEDCLIWRLDGPGFFDPVIEAGGRWIAGGSP